MMLRVAMALVLMVCAVAAAPAEDAATKSKEVAPMENLKAIPFVNAEGTTESLSMYSGKVVLIVNTASKCGYTPQYAGLEELHRKFKDAGLVVVAFPSNDYGGQEPGSNKEIAEFCRSKYDVTFPVKGKMATKGAGKSALYAALTGEGSPFPGEVGWNFEKFVVDRSGKIVARFKSKSAPMSPEVVEAVEKALAP